MKTTVIHHSADYDGIFCREIARKFLPDAELIGWDFADKPLDWPDADKIYIMDLPVDRPFDVSWDRDIHDVRFMKGEVVWIDHHASSIASHPTSIPGYRIDGVAACRLAWQYFTLFHPTSGSFSLPSKERFVERSVSEPLSVRLAGEYDIWDKRDVRADTFQFGLRSVDQGADFWEALLDLGGVGEKAVDELMQNGYLLQRYQRQNDAGMMFRSFMVEWEGLKFLAINTARCNSLTFAAKDKPENGHDALMGFYFNGSKWTVSLYHASHRKDIDLSLIAVKYGGGGHRGACGFTTDKLPFI